MEAVLPSPSPLAAADHSGLRLLGVAHMVNDANQSVVPALIPWLVLHHGFSLATAATLVLAMNLSSSVVQPLFGHLSDRRSMSAVIPLGILLACFGSAMIGVAPTLPLMLVGALLSGIGVAAFHPEASRFANYFAGSKRATGMSWFTAGGYVGFALGPMVVTPLIVLFGLSGTAFLIVPGVAIAVLLWREQSRFQEVRRAVHRARRQTSGLDDWRGFFIFTGVVALRSMTFLAAVTFAPVFAIAVTHVSKPLGETALTALLIAGAVGTVYGGRLADRIDRRRIVTVSLFLTALFAGAIAFAGLHGGGFALFVTLGVGFGVALGLSAGVIVVIGQEYLPQRIGVAAGVTLGLAVTIGGLAAPGFGAIGDRFGLVAVFGAIALFALLSFLSSFAVPKPRTPPITLARETRAR